MRIAIIGPGAMGLLFGAYLSTANEVTMIGRSREKMDDIKNNGVSVEEIDGTVKDYSMDAVTDTKALAPFDLVMVFTKTGATRAALEQNRNIIDEHTVLLTLQNGMGHENVLKEFAPIERILIGTTKEGSYRKSSRSICHSGVGSTAFGTIAGDCSQYQNVADAFNRSGLECALAPEIKRMIWDKIMINASSSVLSGIFQVPQGCVFTKAHVWNIAKKLIIELCATATADGYAFDAAEQIERIEKHLKAAPGGYTSIYADLKAGNKTEVDVINGAVVAEAHRLGMPVPTHEIIVDMVHGMEEVKETEKL